ncbi:hypothetical protein GGR58DRAFT_379833 [Xylaria digitata]|nr:hypothetical protein GGR58DRAFT_379833 [Xylaria digitata]
MTPRFFTCSVPECGRPSVRAIGGCDSCNRHLCLTHMSHSFHKCSDVRETGLPISFVVAYCRAAQNSILMRLD